MKKLFLVLIFLFLSINAFASQHVVEFTDYSDSTETINGTSNAINLNYPGYTGLPYTVQITDSSSAVGALQGLIYVDSTDTGDSSAIWQDLTDGTISGNGMFSIFAPMTHVRVNLSSGTCKARILY